MSDRSEHADRIDADILHRAGIDAASGQNVCVPACVQKTLRGLKHCFGETDVMLPCHLCDPSEQGVLVVMLGTTFHGFGMPTVSFATIIL